MAEKAEIYKGIRQPVKVTGLEPGKEYYAMLVHSENGEYICSEKTVPDAEGLAVFMFAYTQTNNLEEGSLILQVFDVDRNNMVARVKNIARLIETQLGDDKDVPSHQAEEK